MNQLSFDGFPRPVTEAPLLVVPTTAPTRKDSWYKGRVLSHSSIVLYRTCPQRWKFRYIDKVPEKPRSFFSFGKSVHTSLEFLFGRLGQLPTLEETLAHYKERWLREGYDTDAQEKWFYQEGERILRGFYAKHKTDFQKVAQVELKFTVDIEGVPVTGYVDRIDHGSQGGVALVDYKTGKAFDKSRVRKDPQLTLYQIACREILGKEVESVTLYHLNSLTALTVPAHPKTLEDDLRVVIVDTARGINDGKFEPKPDPNGHCQWCDYNQICPGLRSAKQPERQASPELLSLADRLGKLDQKIKELQSERHGINIHLLTAMKQAGLEAIDADFFSVRIATAEGGVPSVLESTSRSPSAAA